ncbi:Regulator of nonsense transcripts 1 [Thelohanellus kitauei]|uniref:Regulator of nonsense transcripts 1 n=1 Tax=Thelohanellus kitauei TaxID=669202 RepID=A0A0C2N5K4_THEKT|nr:Regulator of nonsense transcripts 1 [Thelohanellus kitauei]
MAMNVGGEIKDNSIKEWTIDYCYEELGKYIADQETVTTKILFDDLQDYKKTFSRLIKEEAKYEQKMAEIQETYEIPFKCKVISYEERKIMLTHRLEESKVYLKSGDHVGIRQAGHILNASMGRVVGIRDRGRKIYIEIFVGNVIPTKFIPCYVDLMWCCIPFNRMMTSLSNFTKTSSFGKTYLKNFLLGKEKPSKHFEVTIPGNFQVPGLPNLNKAQIQMIKNSLESRVSLIQGPPGTGKTVTIAAIVYYVVKYLKKKVLVCASSNKAVDNAYKKIEDTGVKVVRVMAKHRQREEMSTKENNLCSDIHESTPLTENSTIQTKELKTVGNSNTKRGKRSRRFNINLIKDTCTSSLAKLPRDIKNLCKYLDLCGLSPRNQKMDSEDDEMCDSSKNIGDQNVNVESPRLQQKVTALKKQGKEDFTGHHISKTNKIKHHYSEVEAEVVCATCCGAGDPRVSGLKFDCVLIDESTQSTEPQSLIPISLCKERLIMVGDQRQLGPVVSVKVRVKRVCLYRFLIGS